MLDLDFVRAQFPALDTPWTLMDNAGGTAPCRQVIDRVRAHMERLPFQLGASYALSVEAGAAVDAPRRRWKIQVTRGIEYERVEREVNLDGKPEASVRIPLRRVRLRSPPPCAR